MQSKAKQNTSVLARFSGPLKGIRYMYNTHEIEGMVIPVHVGCIRYPKESQSFWPK